MKATVILVHGAFAESSSWDGVVGPVRSEGHRVIAPLGDGGADAYIVQEQYHGQFAGDLPAAQAALMSVSQRPVTTAALAEPSGDNPLWRSVPSWFLFGELDRNIPAGAHRVMAERAGARRSVEIPGASHVVGISHPGESHQIILEAARASQLADA